ncbi:unnamed protein product, partial [Polarella glacialis]
MPRPAPFDMGGGLEVICTPARPFALSRGPAHGAWGSADEKALESSGDSPQSPVLGQADELRRQLLALLPSHKSPVGAVNRGAKVAIALAAAAADAAHFIEEDADPLEVFGQMSPGVAKENSPAWGEAVSGPNSGQAEGARPAAARIYRIAGPSKTARALDFIMDYSPGLGISPWTPRVEQVSQAAAISPNTVPAVLLGNAGDWENGFGKAGGSKAKNVRRPAVKRPSSSGKANGQGGAQEGESRSASKQSDKEEVVRAPAAKQLQLAAGGSVLKSPSAPESPSPSKQLPFDSTAAEVVSELPAVTSHHTGRPGSACPNPSPQLHKKRLTGDGPALSLDDSISADTLMGFNLWDSAELKWTPAGSPEIGKPPSSRPHTDQSQPWGQGGRDVASALAEVGGSQFQLGQGAALPRGRHELYLGGVTVQTLSRPSSRASASSVGSKTHQGSGNWGSALLRADPRRGCPRGGSASGMALPGLQQASSARPSPLVCSRICPPGSAVVLAAEAYTSSFQEAPSAVASASESRCGASRPPSGGGSARPRARSQPAGEIGLAAEAAAAADKRNAGRPLSWVISCDGLE